MLILFGFLISLSLVMSLQCYRRYRVGDERLLSEQMTCSEPGSKCVTQCYITHRPKHPPTGRIFSSCGTICNEDEICRDLAKEVNATNCRVTCCDYDFCNPWPGGKQGDLVHACVSQVKNWKTLVNH